MLIQNDSIISQKEKVSIWQFFTLYFMRETTSSDDCVRASVRHNSRLTERLVSSYLVLILLI